MTREIGFLDSRNCILPHTRLDFFRDVSSRLKLDSSKYSDFWTSLKNLEHYKDWLKKAKLGKIVKGYIEDEQGVHCYDAISLIRVIRNIYDHYGDVPAQVAKELGEIPRGYDKFFSTRFPTLLMDVYNVFKVSYTKGKQIDTSTLSSFQV